MGIAYVHDPATGLSVSVWDGEITPAERRRHMEQLATDADWGSGALLLTDLTGVSGASAPGAESLLEAAGAFLRRLARRARNTKWAIVADTTFTHAQRFGAYIEEEVQRMIVFNDSDTACVWLGVNAADVRGLVEQLRTQIRSSDTSILNQT